MSAAKCTEPIRMDQLGDVVSTSEYARLMGVSPDTLTRWWRHADRAVAQPINPHARRKYVFSRQAIERKMRAR